MESCAGCGFVWESVPAAQIGARLEVGVDEIVDMLDEAAEAGLAATRPEPEIWSVTEYAAHVRDVLLGIRDRLITIAVEDEPESRPIYRDQRVDMGMYARDTPEILRRELPMAAALFDRSYHAFTPQQMARTVRYGYPAPAVRTMLWACQQAVHEVEHHRADIAAVLDQLRI
jgi:hypothetical protein